MNMWPTSWLTNRGRKGGRKREREGGRERERAKCWRLSSKLE